MAAHGVVGVLEPAKGRTTIPAEENPPMPDPTGRRCAPTKPDVTWVARRLRSSLGYIPPIDWVQRYRQTRANQAA